MNRERKRKREREREGERRARERERERKRERERERERECWIKSDRDMMEILKSESSICGFNCTIISKGDGIGGSGKGNTGRNRGMHRG